MTAPFLQIGQAVTDEAIRTVNFFNGRLLTGGDLGREQQARREALALQGMALGDGIAEGLEVSPSETPAPSGRTAVQVSAGLAVNRDGRVLHLAEPVQLVLDPAPESEASVTCLFGDCSPTTAGNWVADEGLYLLTIAPTFVSEGRAQVSGMGDAGARCAFDATVEAVRFRLLPVRREVHDENPAAADFRNRIAYRCFGNSTQRSWPLDLTVAGERGDDLIEEMLGHGLTKADVPLALIHFGGEGSTPAFIDMWGVRRQLCRRVYGNGLTMVADPRRTIVGMAMYRQFQDEIDDIARVAGQLAQTRARNRFAWLPAAGMLPVLNDAQVSNFFTGFTISGPHFIDASMVEPMLQESLLAPAIPTKPGEPGADHALWLYRVASLPPGRVPLLIFANGNLPYRGDARFDLHHWDQANYALNP